MSCGDFYDIQFKGVDFLATCVNRRLFSNCIFNGREESKNFSTYATLNVLSVYEIIMSLEIFDYKSTQKSGLFQR